MWLGKKRFITLLSIGGILLTNTGMIMTNTAYASENGNENILPANSDILINEWSPSIVNENEITIVDDDYLIDSVDEHSEVNSNNNTSSRMVNTIRYRKKNVKKSTEWSAYKRVSDNLKTGNKGGSITTTKSASFGATTTGSVYGIQVAASATISSSVGYTLNVGGNQRVYVGYRVKYAVEKGTREQYDLTTGKVYSSNSYTRKVPQHGEYTLIKY